MQTTRAVKISLVCGLAAMTSLVAAAEVTSATAKQKAMEGLALRLSEAPEVQKAKAQQRKMFLERPTAQTIDGKATLDDAATQTFYGAVVLVANTDPHHPEVLMHCLYEHVIDGQRFPAALHGGMQNPDNVYRVIPISFDSRYELKGVRRSPAPAQVTFELMSSIPGVPTSDERSAAVIERNMKAGRDRGVNQQLAMLTDRSLKVAPDGSYTITIDPDPANGRPNHIQTTPEARALYVRDALSDWANQTPDQLRIIRTAGPDTPVRTEQAMIAEAAALVPRYAQFWLDLVEKSVNASTYPLNDFTAPGGRSGGWGFISHAKFDLKDDEALVFTADPLDAAYHSALVGNHWWIAADAAQRSGSLNTAQSKPNADGTITYVVAARDPGVANWLDTGGLHQGVILVRWQGTPLGVADFKHAMRDVKVIRIADLPTQLPKETVFVTPAERARQLAVRFESYQRRFAIP